MESKTREQIGALGVLMAMRLFQMDGGASLNSTYDIMTPIFDRVEILLNQNYYQGSQFVISTKNNTPENVYIQSARLNGVEWNRFTFSHEDFQASGELELTLGPQPNEKWGLNE